MKRFKNIKLVLPDGLLEMDLRIADDGKIAAHLEPESPLLSEEELIDGKSMILFPGMIDLLTHGYGNFLYSDAEENSLVENSIILPKHGVTGYAPSITSFGPGLLENTLGKLSKLSKGEGARVLGFHSEGPCLNSPGAHNPDWLQKPSPALAQLMLEASQGQLLAVTCAPELDGAEHFIKELVAAGVSIHLGHSSAPAEEVPRYIEWGVHAVTHVYDVFVPAQIVESGLYPLSLVDALIAEPEICLGVIADTVHVAPKQLQLLAQLPADRVFLETDSVKYSGLAPGRFDLGGGMWVTTSEDDAGRLDDGLLAGSTLCSDKGLRNYLDHGKCNLAKASIATSLNPARLIKRDDQFGSLEVGKFADMVLLHPESLEVHATYVAGELVYQKEE